MHQNTWDLQHDECSLSSLRSPDKTQHKPNNTVKAKHLSVFASIIHASMNLPQLSLVVSPVCSLHPWVFHLLAWELVMMPFMEVDAYTRTQSVCVLLGSLTPNYLSSSKHAALWSWQLAHITAVGYTAAAVSLCWGPMSHFSSLAADSPDFLSCQIQEKASDLPKTLFYGGLSRRPPLAYSEITQWL